MSPTGQSTLHLLGLRSADVVGRVTHKLEGCRYRTRHVGDGVIYSASVAVMTRCAGPYGLDVPPQTSVGVVPASNLVLLADSAMVLDSALRHEGDLRRDTTVTALLRPLAGSASIVLDPEPSICSHLAGFGNQPTPALVKAILRANPPGPPSAGIGIGIRLARGTATGTIAVDYATSRTARAALPRLARRARLDYSFESDAPYAALLHIDRQRRSGPDAVLDVSSAHGLLPLYDMWFNFDLAFARC